ncbi:tandem-95 repeat protein [Pseudoalteromonas sp. SCSIO 43201]|uniref:tandem-95 repeat protein n=1 Tax=Pseudoalteromonas sp. SCSIO 43201 TaxID=2822842 RepID=UPI002075B951|nr:Ig-like domain-containing protein [Pseudoalteromonas sp. SCSIO 43201]USD30450.1 tandem-95 repeat protein [Pseudoalteromonas sp. SCSIO 43201]
MKLTKLIKGITFSWLFTCMMYSSNLLAEGVTLAFTSQNQGDYVTSSFTNSAQQQITIFADAGEGETLDEEKVTIYNTDFYSDTVISSKDDSGLTRNRGYKLYTENNTAFKFLGFSIYAQSGYNVVNGYALHVELTGYSASGKFVETYSVGQIDLEEQRPINPAGDAWNNVYRVDIRFPMINSNGRRNGKYGYRHVIESVRVSDAVVPANTPPVFRKLIAGAAYQLGGEPVQITSQLEIYDSELSAQGDYFGSTLTIMRDGGANQEDVFSHPYTNLAENGNFEIFGQHFGKVEKNSEGVLRIKFDRKSGDSSKLSKTSLNTAIAQIKYKNTSQTPSDNVSLKYTFNDGISDSQGDNTLGVKIAFPNRAPTDITLAKTSFKHSELGTSKVLGALSTVDPDTGDTHTYELATSATQATAGTCSLPNGDSGDIDNMYFTIVEGSLHGKYNMTGYNGFNGNFSVCVLSKDSEGETFKKPIEFSIIDDEAPEAPSIPTMTDASNSGSKSDQITNIKEPTFTGTAEPNSTVILYAERTVQNLQINTTETIELGRVRLPDYRNTWEIKATGILKYPNRREIDETSKVYATATDFAGNTSAESAKQTVRIDAVPPKEYPEIVLSSSSDTGLSSTDKLTKEKIPTFTSTSSGDSSHRYSLYKVGSGTSTYVTDFNTGSFCCRLTARLPTNLALTDGSHTFKIVVNDAAGNTASGSSNTIEVDTTAPTGITAAFDQDDFTKENEKTASITISGLESQGKITATITVEGQNATPIVRETLITSTTGTQKLENIDLTSLPEGTLKLSVVVSDWAGNESAAATDTAKKQYNAKPVISGTPATQVNEDSPYYFKASATDTDAGDALTFSINKNLTDPKLSWLTFDTRTGEFRGTPKNEHVGKIENIIISVTDEKDTVSLPAFTLEVVNVNDAPTAITASATEVNQSITGENKTVITVETTDVDASDSHHYALVTAGTSDNGRCAANTDNTAFTITENKLLSKQKLEARDYTVCVQSNDGTTAFEQALTVKVKDDIAPATPSVPALHVDSNSGITTDNITNDRTPTFIGTGENGSTVILKLANGDEIGRGVVNEGKWSITSSELAENSATYVITATATDSSEFSDDSPASVAYTLIIDTDKPVTQPTIKLSGDSTSSENDKLTNKTTFTFSGTASTDDTVEILVNGEVVGSAKPGSDGNWSLQPAGTYSDGDHTFAVRVVDNAGNTLFGDNITITVDTKAPAGITAMFDQTLINKANEQTTSITLTGLEEKGTLKLTFTGQMVDGRMPEPIVLTPDFAAVNGKQTIANIDLSSFPEGEISLSILVTDEAGNTSDAVTASVTKRYNFKPELSGQPATTVDEDSEFDFTPTLTDTDEGDTHTFTINKTPSWAKFEPTTGRLFGTPKNEHVGETTGIIITVNDGTDETSLDSFDLKVINTNDAPTGENVILNVKEGETLEVNATGGLMENGKDDDTANNLDEKLIVLAGSQPKYGTLTLNQDGSYKYIHDGSENHQDSFTFYYQDNAKAESDKYTATITVEAVEDAPTVANDVINLTEDTPSAKVDLLANDTDPENNMDKSSMTLVIQPTKGKVNVENGIVIYTPNDNVNGEDSFTYTVKDTQQQVSKEAKVQVNIRAVNDVPKAAGFIVNIDEDTTSDALAVRATATDVEDINPKGDIRITQQPSKGRVTINQEAGTLVYAPNENANKEDSFKYVIADNDGAESNETEVSINIGAVNDRPTVTNDTTTTKEDESVTLAILANDEDIEDETFAAAKITLQDGGDYELAKVTVGDNGELTITPKQDKNGLLTFTYTVADSEDLRSEPASVEVTITPVNDAPVAKENTAQLLEDGSVEVNVLGNDTDVDSELKSTSVTVVQQPKNGTAKVTVKGAILYTPNGNYFGNDELIYTVEDTEGLVSNQAKVTITIESVNDAPVISGTPSQSVDEDQAYRFTPAVSDVDQDALTFSIENQPSWTRFDDATGTLTGTPTEGQDGNYAGIVISVTDGKTTTSLNAFSITVNAVNDAPVISGTPTLNVKQDKPYRFAASASDIDSESLTFTITNKPNWAEFSTESGVLSGTPTRDDVGTYRGIVISVSDGLLSDSLATFNLEVLAVNAAPIANNMQQTVKEDGTTSFVANVSDIDGDTLTVEVQNQPQRGQLSVQGKVFNYTPLPQFNGTDTFTYVVKDGTFTSTVATVTMIVTAVNDLPIAIDDSYSFTATNSGQYTLPVLENDTDADGDALRIVGAKSSYGSVVIEGNALNLLVEGMSQGQAVITYAIEDSNKGRDQGRAEVTISSNSNSDTRPTIIAPPAITVNATGLFTKVDLGTATANDSNGVALPVSLNKAQPIFSPGNHLVHWKAQDSQGQEVVASQVVKVNPLVSLQKDSQVSEDRNYHVNVYLNGDAPSYPVTIPYTVTGTADAADHDLQSGEFIITSGTQASIEFSVFADSEVEGNETIVISLGDSVNAGAKSTTTITIVEDNVAPNVRTVVSQNGEERSLVTATNAEVSVTAQVADVNPNDQVNVEWQASSELENLSFTDNVFTFNPQSLAVGIYKVVVIASDDATPSLSTKTEVYIEVVDALATLSDSDSDGDLIPDNQEGYQDSDGDGIPDYLDNIDTCNVMPQHVDQSSQFLVEGDAGVCLRKGATVAQNQTGGIRLLDSEVTTDTEALNIGGIFDYIAVGLPKDGDVYSIVIPQRKPIPANAVYRKFKDGQWNNFVIDASNQVLSARGELGFCPPPGDSQWTDGMTEGDYCVQLRIQDGGANDDDGVANGTVVDPGGVAVPVSGNSLPVANSDALTVFAGQNVVFDALANDTDTDDNTLTITSASVDFGQVDVVENQLSYSAPAMFVGIATIQYGITDGVGGTAQSVVMVSIVNNQAPNAINDSANTDGTTIMLDVLANDTDPEGSALTLVSATAKYGTVTIEGAKLRYVPANNFEGIDTIRYVISDEFGTKAEAEVSVTVKTTPHGKVENSSSGSMGLLSLLLISALVLRRSKSGLPAFALVSSIALVTTSAMASEWKVAGTVGVTSADSDVSNESFATTYLDEKSTSWSIGAFYQLTPQWDIGLRYIDLGEGKVEFSGLSATPGEIHKTLSSIAPALPKGAALQVGYETNLASELVGKLFVGVLSWKSEINSRLNSSASLLHKESGANGYVGAGLHYQLNSSIYLGVDYSHYFISENNIDEIAASVSYRF